MRLSHTDTHECSNVKTPHVIRPPSCGKSSGFFPVWGYYEMVICLLPSSSRNDVAGTHRTLCLPGRSHSSSGFSTVSIDFISKNYRVVLNNFPQLLLATVVIVIAQGPGFWLMGVLV